MEPSVWTRSVPFVRDGQAVNAQVTNAPTQVLADRTAALKAILDSIQAGEQLVLRNAPLGEDVEEGHVVYLNPATLRYERALARYKDLVGSDGRLLPADTAVIAGIVYNKASAAVGDLLCSGMVTLSDAAVLRLFNGETPSTAFYYLSSLTAGTVETSTPALLVRTCQWVAGNIIRVFAPTFEPGTHEHRGYTLYAADWKAASTFDPGLVPSGAYFGYNLNSVQAIEQMLSEVILPAVGGPEFVWAYAGDESFFINGMPYYANQLPAETPDGVRVDFTLPYGHVFAAGSLVVRLNGQAYAPEHIQAAPARTGFRIIGEGVIPTADDRLTCGYSLESSGSSGSEEGLIPLSGRHVDPALILLNETGIWWMAPEAPDRSIYLTVTAADVRELALIHSIWSKTPNTLGVQEQNGRVGLELKALGTQNDWTEDYLVGSVDLVNGLVHRRKGVTRVLGGQHLAVSPEEGTGEVVVDLRMFQNYNLDALITNLNNAITRTEAPYVFTEFPQGRVSGASFMVPLPNLSPDTLYELVLWGLFLGVGVELDAPLVNCAVLPTPTAEGVDVYTVPGFPVSMGTITAGTKTYLVECPLRVPVDGLSSGQVFYDFTVTTPAAPVKLLGTGLRLVLKDA